MQEYYGFRARRGWRKAQRGLKQGWRQLKHLSSVYVFHRTKHLRHVQRFAGMVLLVLALSLLALWWQIGALKDHYLVDGGKSGGTFIEGSLGPITRLNPIFPDEPGAETVNKLIFSSLLKYNGNGQLEGDLVENWEVSEDGTVYTLHLREELFWQDGQPLTAEDVLFTVQTIQNPQVRSPLLGSWQGVVAQAPDLRTVVFSLPATYSAFDDSLTLQIVPKHLLEGINPAQLRLADFNQRPVGSGPFMFEEFVASQRAIRLKAYSNYVHGAPKLKRFIVRTYEDKDQLYKAFAERQITASSGFGVYEAEQYEQIGHGVLYEWPITNEAFAFFNTKQPILNDAKVRRALTQATKPQAAAEQFDYRFTSADAPLLPEHIGYNEQFTQATFDQAKASAELDAAGWVVGEGGIRYKDGQPLKLQLVTQNSDVYPALAASLQEQWRAVGVDLQVKLLSPSELSQDHISTRNYDVLLYGVALGADSDVYSFWHSSAAEHPGLNFSNWQSKEADVALESARSRQDQQLRAAKYETFLKVWRDEAPAIALYRPDFLYATQARVRGLDVERLITPSDRFYNVQNWTINSEPVLKRVAE